MRKWIVKRNGEIVDGGELNVSGDREEIPKADGMMELMESQKVLTTKVDALTQSNQMLEDCLVEMANVVYQ